MRRLFPFLFFLLVVSSAHSQSPENDSLLVVQQPDELFLLNPLAWLFKDTSGKLGMDEIAKRDSLFFPLRGEMYEFAQDDHVEAYWLRVRIKNETSAKLRYVIYFHPGFDTIESYIHRPDQSVLRQAISGTQSATLRPLYISQETVFPVVLEPGQTTAYFRMANHSIYSRQLNSIVVNLAEEQGFINYFLHARHYQGIALGMLCVMLVFHIFIYFFFRDRTYLFFVLNIFITLVYLLIRKSYHEEMTWLTPVLPLLRYAHDPAAMLLCATVVLFSQSFLNTKTDDPFLHRIMNYLLVALGLVTLCMVSLQFLHLMNIASIYLGFVAAVVVLTASVRSYLRGYTLALYAVFGFLIFLIVPLIYIFPMPGYRHFKNSESDLHYFAEALRSLIFAVGIADRFYQIKKEAVRQEMERRNLEFERERQLQDEKERISRDLHDNIGSQLTSLSQGLNRLAKNGTADSDKLNELYDHANAAILELRETIWVINRDRVTLEEFNDKINNLIWRLRQQDEQVSFEFHNDIVTVTHTLVPAQAINLFRIVQESVNNSLKHSQATAISVSLQWQEENVLRVSVRDNGHGFDTQTPGLQDHYGILNMRKRAEHIHGTFRIDSGKEGTTVVVVVAV